MPSFGAVLIGCQFGNIPPAPRVPAKRRTAYVVPAWARLSTPICDVLTASVDRCVAASSRPDQPNASPVASEGPYLPSRVITLPITKKSPILAELERPRARTPPLPAMPLTTRYERPPSPVYTAVVRFRHARHNFPSSRNESSVAEVARVSHLGFLFHNTPEMVRPGDAHGSPGTACHRAAFQSRPS